VCFWRGGTTKVSKAPKPSPQRDEGGKKKKYHPSKGWGGLSKENLGEGGSPKKRISNKIWGGPELTDKQSKGVRAPNVAKNRKRSEQTQKRLGSSCTQAQLKVGRHSEKKRDLAPERRKNKRFFEQEGTKRKKKGKKRGETKMVKNKQSKRKEGHRRRRPGEQKQYRAHKGEGGPDLGWGGKYRGMKESL